MDTIYALSSGAPPAGVAVVRVSGPRAAFALEQLAGGLPQPRRARLASLRDAGGDLLDRALVLWFPGPASATGEDLAEFHLHGGRAVVAAVEVELAAIDGLRRAEAGEFTRRGFSNGRMDLAEAEGLADLLSAETELQHRAAIDLAGGALSRKVEGWRDALLLLSARLEAVLDFDDEDDVEHISDDFRNEVAALAEEIGAVLASPPAEVLREGYRVALAGPPNAGKSTLFNALVDSEAAITAALAGTTRDVLTRPVALAGVPFTFVDMAGLRAKTEDEIEAVGIARAEAEIARADLVLWLGPEGLGPADAWEVDPQSDRTERAAKSSPKHVVSAATGEGMSELKASLVACARGAMPKPGDFALNRRQRDLIGEAHHALSSAGVQNDGLILAEHFRQARLAFDRLVGRSSTEDVLDALFGRFCIGK